ncbi:MAG: hypothetical protein JO357_02355 [Hyphomicrobiales bacterium]|nr:hypothetical protein [Hyphomicrobiales bacterium]MBV9751526.1 hypothetical protein [Hyphomicrobiales bacterium]
MWFLVRAAFCIGLVYSLTPDADVARDARAPPAALTQSAAPAFRHSADGAIATCSEDPKLCLEAAQLLASSMAETRALPDPAGAAEARVASDTLTATDRATPWRGPKETRGSTRLRGVSRPPT